MSAFICYELTETIAGSGVSCVLKTKDPFLALADMMLKVRRPITGHVNRSLWLTKGKVGVESRAVPFNMPAVFDFITVVADKETDQPLFKIEIKTIISKKPVATGLLPSSMNHYKDNSYYKALNVLQDRLLDWAQEDVEVAKVLACIASRDPDHIFWNEQGHMDINKNLVMG